MARAFKFPKMVDWSRIEKNSRILIQECLLDPISRNESNVEILKTERIQKMLSYFESRHVNRFG